MPKPKPIRLTGYGGLMISVVGYRSKRGGRPYLTVESGRDSTGLVPAHGFVEDRDVKRLLAWCQDCLKERKPSKPKRPGN